MALTLASGSAGGRGNEVATVANIAVPAPEANGIAWSLAGHSSQVMSCVCSIGYFITSDASGQSLVWTVDDLASTAPHNAGVFHTRNEHVAVLDTAFLTPRKMCGACGDGCVTVWDVETGQAELTLARQAARYLYESAVVINAVATSGYNIVVWGGDDGFLNFTDVRINGSDAKKPLSVSEQKPLNMRVPVTAVEVNEDVVYAGGVDGMVRCYDRRTLRELYRLPAHSDVVCSTSASPGASLLLSSGMDGTLGIWDVQPFAVSVESRLLERVTADHQHEQRNLVRASWSPCSSRFVSGSGDGRVLYGTVDGAAVQPLRYRHSVGPANGAYFLDNSWVVSVGSDPGAIVQRV